MFGEAAHACRAVLAEHAGYPEPTKPARTFWETRGTDVEVSTESFPGYSVMGEPARDGADGERAQVRPISRTRSIAKAR